MLSIKENLLQTINGGTPERFVNQYEAFAMVLAIDPLSITYPMGEEGSRWRNAWGVTLDYPVGAPGAMPVHAPETIVINDITKWREQIKAPSLVFADELWEPAESFAASINRKEQYVTIAVAPGLFEQSHYLMGMEEAMVSLLAEPEEYSALINFLADWEIEYAQQLIDHLHPDALHHHDDWGSAMSTFMSPSVFEELFVPVYKKLYGFYKENGIELIIHHSDSYAATLVPFMIEIGIDIWQGVMSTNDIPSLIKEYGGKISFMGGIDNAKVDRAGWTHDLVASEVEHACRTCGKQYFIPSTLQGMPATTYPGVYESVTQEIERMSGLLF